MCLFICDQFNGEPNSLSKIWVKGDVHFEWFLYKIILAHILLAFFFFLDWIIGLGVFLPELGLEIDPWSIF